MTRGEKVGLSLLALGALVFVGMLVDSFQYKITKWTVSAFEIVGCETGHMPKDSDAFLRQAPSNWPENARFQWEPLGMKAKVVEGRRLRVTGTYVWAFTREHPLEMDCVGRVPQKILDRRKSTLGGAQWTTDEPTSATFSTSPPAPRPAPTAG